MGTFRFKFLDMKEVLGQALPLSEELTAFPHTCLSEGTCRELPSPSALLL